MKHHEKQGTSSSPESQKVTEDPNQHGTKMPAGDDPRSADDSGQKIDRPGFDLGGSSGDTHAGSGVGLGTDAFDTPGNRRLPGRRLDNKLTIPRWGGPEPCDTTASDEKTAGAETPSTSETKKRADRVMLRSPAVANETPPAKTRFGSLPNKVPRQAEASLSSAIPKDQKKEITQ
ncbi:hypothetical protein [Thetidibacter halocola]|uniref:Uncharacterized protein n=1 Tax=Thetidibacter halocola TaxID=2827239 RepID=A0A8J7WJA6_9RHOB|nr:hypothetical protein [Thetidibacter halocola]MBS0126266.1 hypothetical protein [Thetidibacter halocola]